MRYYDLDQDGRVLASYARPQPDKDLQRLEEPVAIMSRPRWTGSEWEDDPVPTTVNEGKTQIIAMCDNLAAPILRAYPQAEEKGWIEKDREARAFMAIASGDRTPSDAPFINAIVAQEEGSQTNTERVTSMETKCQSIITRADEWRLISAFVEGVRTRYEALINNAADGDEIDTHVANAQVEIDAAKTQFDLSP